MIQEIRISNFFSIKEDVTLSFEATGDCFDSENQTVEVAPNVRLLRFVSIFGPNASGKSNILLAFNYLSRLWNNRLSTDYVGPQKYICPFLFDETTKSKPSEFSILFWLDGVQYRYGLTSDTDTIYEEELVKISDNQEVVLFSRGLDNGISTIKFSDILSLSDNAKEIIELNCIKSVSLLAALSNVNKDIKFLSKAANYLRNSICKSVTTNALSKKNYQYLIENKQRAVQFLTKNGFYISDIIEDKDDSENISLKFVHNIDNQHNAEKYQLQKDYESIGTLTVLDTLSYLYNVSNIPEAFVSIDEIDSSLHPDIVERLVDEFIHNPVFHNVQLVCTTHYDGLLNLVNDLLREDSVFFTDKRADGATDLYSLVEFKDLESIKSMQKAYRLGIFGAIPKTV